MNEMKILILVNDSKLVISDDLERWREYEQERLGISLSFDIKECDLGELKHKDFGIVVVSDGKSEPGYGLDNIKEIIREEGIAPAGFYHAVAFLYNYEATPLYKDKKKRGWIKHWCYFEPLHPGTEFMEIAMTRAWDKKGDLFRVLTHEFRHACVNRVRRRGVFMPDVMDQTYVPADCKTNKPAVGGGCTVGVPYYKEFEPEANDGNRAIQNVLLKSQLPTILIATELTGHINALKKLIAELQAQLAKLLMPKSPEPAPESKLIKWAEAIKLHEGWFVGSRSYRNNNPGNFRYSSFIRELGATGEDRVGVGANQGGYSQFPTYQKGWDALLEFLRTAQRNQLYAYRNYAIAKKRPGNMPTLGDFFAVYAPSGDDNNPDVYAKAVAKYIGDGVTVNTPINQII